MLKCPQCGRAVRRSSGGEDPGSLVRRVSFGELLTGAYWCQHCGRIAKEKFPPEDRRRITLVTTGYFVAMIGMLGLVALMAFFGLVSARWLTH